MEPNTENMEQKNRSRTTIFSALKYVAVFVLGAVLALYASGVSFKEIYVNHLIKYYYDGEIDKKQETEGALWGKVEALDDPHSYYIPKEIGTDYFNQKVTGEYGGVGISIAVENEKCVVKEVFEGTPAQKAGIKAGDCIIAIDGKAFNEYDFTTISKEIRGEVGTVLSVVIEREGKELSFDIERAIIDTPAVYGKMLEGGIAYLKITQFDEDANIEIEREMDKLENAKSVIVDLRGNPGGILGVCVDSLELFLEKGDTIVSTKGRRFKEKYVSKEEPKYTMPMAVLINENSASAAEVFSACIKDNDRGTVVGKKSYGKGSIQRTFEFSENTGMNLTIGHFFSPNGSVIDKVGVIPDVEVEQKEGKTDTQLEEAIKILKK